MITRLPGLSAAQLVGTIETAAELEPHLLVDVASRGDVSGDVAEALARVSPSWIVADVLDRLDLSVALIDMAVEAHGAIPGLVILCGRRGWLDHAVELAGRVRREDADRVPHLWERTIGAVPVEVRAASVRAALARPAREPFDEEASPWAQQRQMDEWREAEKVHSARIWDLLAPEPGLWLTFAVDPQLGLRVQRLLLERASALPDEILRACLPATTHDALREDSRGDSFLAGFRLGALAKTVRRWPRLREIAGDEIRRVISETYEDGWTPTGEEYLGSDWNAIRALSELCDDPALLAATADAFRKPDRSTGRLDADESQERQEQRLAAAIALFANRHAPTDTLLGIAEGLDEHALRRVLPTASGAAEQAARARLTALQAAATAREAALCRVPADEELARLPDPSGELRKHLRWLRGPAKQREAITAALLRSRFTTPDILRELRAHAVLDSPDQVEQAATMIASTCADRSARWVALRDQLKEPGSKTVTFGAWLDQLVK